MGLFPGASDHPVFGAGAFPYQKQKNYPPGPPQGLILGSYAIGLGKDPRRRRFLMSEVPLYGLGVTGYTENSVGFAGSGPGYGGWGLRFGGDGFKFRVWGAGLSGDMDRS